MKVTTPSDCGNVPRLLIVADIAQHWAAGDTEALELWLTEDAQWAVVGGETVTGRTEAAQQRPPVDPQRLEIITVITHGRLASCDGVLDDGERTYAFSHVLRFAGTTKTAKVAEIRTYLIEQIDEAN